MQSNKKRISRFTHWLCHPEILIWWVIIVVLIPNFALNFTEGYPLIWGIINVTFPLACYMLLFSIFKRSGLATWLMLPFMALAAFQLVLIYLYGGSIIGVDMFLNVTTTNFSEASQLLSNLGLALVAVILIYIPPLVIASISLARKEYLSSSYRKELVVWGMAFLLFSVLMLVVATGLTHSIGSPKTQAQIEKMKLDEAQFVENVFPVNVIYNLCEAIHRDNHMRHYKETSANFSYNATSERDASEREIYIFVIGETSRSSNWQLAGYDRETNPMLTKEPDFVFFPYAVSESNITHKSVPMMLSFVTSENYDSLNYSKSIITAMKEVGFYTRFYSNQAPNNSYTQFFGDEADETLYISHNREGRCSDIELTPLLNYALADSIHNKQFIVLHTYGSHFAYSERYPHADSFFKPDAVADASEANREQLINAYDNTIRHTDKFLAQIIEGLRQEHCNAALVYSSDHGEDIYDDYRHRFLHASPIPTSHQLHVGMGMWLSDELKKAHPEFPKALAKTSKRYVSPHASIFNTLMDIAGVQSPYVDKTKSLVNPNYEMPQPRYLNDRNQGRPLWHCGMDDIDIENLRTNIPDLRKVKP